MKLPDEPEVIIPSELDAEEQWRRNGEYVSKLDYDALRSLCEQLKEDAERWQWLYEHFEEHPTGWEIELKINGAPSFETLEQCIDASR